MQSRPVFTRATRSTASVSPMPTDDSATLVGDSSAPSPPALHRAAKRELSAMPSAAIQDRIQELYEVLSNQTYEETGLKYKCLHEGCGKGYPRRNAIVEHICKHINYRPHACSHEGCKASFVRPNDCVRHEQIHTGTKTQTCPCGSSFARLDALLKHRQRGICVGGLRTKKRGRSLADESSRYEDEDDEDDDNEPPVRSSKKRRVGQKAATNAPTAKPSKPPKTGKGATAKRKSAAASTPSGNVKAKPRKSHAAPKSKDTVRSRRIRLTVAPVKQDSDMDGDYSDDASMESEDDAEASVERGSSSDSESVQRADRDQSSMVDGLAVLSEAASASQAADSEGRSPLNLEPHPSSPSSHTTDQQQPSQATISEHEALIKKSNEDLNKSLMELAEIGLIDLNSSDVMDLINDYGITLHSI